MIKKIIAVVCVALFFVGAVCASVTCWIEPEQPCANNVRFVDVVWWGIEQDGTLLLCDEQGQEWAMTGLPELTGEHLMLEIHNNNTPNRYWDDEVINIWQTAEPLELDA